MIRFPLQRPLAMFGMSVLLVAYPGFAPAAVDDVHVISLQTGHSVEEEAPGLTRLAVGNPSVAGVVPIETRSFVINAKAPGHTSILAWENGTRAIYEVTVSDQSLDEVARLLRNAIGIAEVDVVTFGQTLVVKGQVADGVALAHVADVIKRFNGVSFGNSGSATVVNALSVTEPMGVLAGQLADNSDTHGVHIENDPDGNVIVTGTVHDRTTAEDVLQQVHGLAGAYLKPDSKVIDRLNIATTSQIDVKVYVLEIDRTASSQLGIRLGTGQIAPGSTSPTLSTNANLTFLENTPNNPLNLGPFTRVSMLAPTIDLLLSQGHARLLSAPDLVSLPGTAASFLVGGQIPIPVSTGLGAVSIQYETYGVQLNVTPNLMPDGSIETKINPQISDIDLGDGVTLNGTTIPALKTSSLTTDVITKDGESIVLGGLLRRVETKTLQKIPLLSSIPILGKMFTDTSYSSTNTDVVFVMTPTVITR